MINNLIFRIRTFFIYLVIAVGSTLIDRYKNDSNSVNRLRIWISRNALRMAGIAFETKGRLQSDTDLIVVNHQSMMDIFLLEIVVGSDVRFVGRKGIMDIWPIGLVVRAVGHITIDRSDRRSAVKLLKEVKAKKGKKVVIFPEGTRSLTGEIKTFEAGAKIVAEKLALKVQPIVIKDLRNCYVESEKYSKKGTVHLEILPPVELKEGWYEKCRADMIAAKKEI